MSTILARKSWQLASSARTGPHGNPKATTDSAATPQSARLTPAMSPPAARCLERSSNGTLPRATCHEIQNECNRRLLLSLKALGGADRAGVGGNAAIAVVPRRLPDGRQARAGAITRGVAGIAVGVGHATRERG